MKTKPLIFVYIICFLSACGGEKNNTKELNSIHHKESIEEQEKSELNSVTFFCGQSEWIDKYTPKTELFGIFNNDTIKLADLNNCRKLQKERYEGMNIPNDAVAAIYSFHAGYGMYFYATIEYGIGKIYKNERNETSKDEYSYDLVGTYEKDEYTANNR